MKFVRVIIRKFLAQKIGTIMRLYVSFIMKLLFRILWGYQLLLLFDVISLKCWGLINWNYYEVISWKFLKLLIVISNVLSARFFCMIGYQFYTHFLWVISGNCNEGISWVFMKLLWVTVQYNFRSILLALCTKRP